MRVCALSLVLALLALGAACDIGGEGPASPVPSPSPVTTPSAGKTPAPTPSPVGSPGVLDGVDVVPLSMGGEAGIPDDIALIVETGCWQCDGPTEGFLRVYRDRFGEIRTETLLSIERLGLPPRRVTTEKGVQEKRPYITGFAVNQDASEMVVSACTQEWCGSGGLYAWSEDAKTALLRSTDGGVTWQNFGDLDGSGSVLGLVREGVVLVALYEAELAPATFYLFPGGDPVEPPQAAAAGVWPLVLPGGAVLWQGGDGRLLRSDGSQFEVLPKGVQPSSFGSAILRDPSGERFALLWWVEQGLQHLGLFGRDGRITGVFSLPDFLLVGAWLASDLMVGNTGVSPDQLTSPTPEFFLGILPALIDLDAGLIHPITDPFLDPDYRGGRSFVRAVMRGPFARVVGTDSCLNVRAAPGTAAEVLECVADDVLLRDTGETRQVDEAVWLRVLTPAGTEGWASVEFLER